MFTVLSRFSPVASKAVRSPRPPYVFLRVGEVVIDRKGFMVGVVVSWDPEMRAPTEWIDRVYANSEVSDSITVQGTYGKSRVPLYSVTLFHNDKKWQYFFCGCTYLYTQSTKAENTPHYKVLFSGHGPSSVAIGYLPQTQLQRVTGHRVCLKKKKSLSVVSPRTTSASTHLPLVLSIPARYSHFGKLLHTFRRRAFRHAALAPADLPRGRRQGPLALGHWWVER